MADLILNLTGMSRRKIQWEGGESSSPSPTEDMPSGTPRKLGESFDHIPDWIPVQVDDKVLKLDLDFLGAIFGKSRTLRETIRCNRPVSAIINIRAQLGLGPKEAKEILDAYWEPWRKKYGSQGAHVVHQTKPVPKIVPIPKGIKSGNGHKSEMTRKLTDPERSAIRAEFITINGCGSEDHWVTFRKEIDSEIAIFQVTGFVSYLHRDVAAGGETAKSLPDLGAYLVWLKGQYKLWAQYNSPKYEVYRKKNTEVTEGVILKSSPKFAAGFPVKFKYA